MAIPFQRLLIVVAVAIVWIEPAKCQEPKSTELQSLVAGDPSAFIDVFVQEHDRTNAFVKRLIDYLDTPTDPDLKFPERDRIELARQEVADELGNLHAEKAVPSLVQHLIEVKAYSRLGRNMDPDIGGYPCAISLAMIGKAAVEPIVWRLQGQHPITDEEITVATCVLEKILGNSGAMKRLQEAVQQRRKGTEWSNELDKDYTSHDVKDDPTLVTALQILAARSKPEP